RPVALRGAMPRPRARPYELHMNAPCALASHSRIAPGSTNGIVRELPRKLSAATLVGRMFEIGNSLREARVRRGVDFAQAELATKIRGKYLRALEDDQFDVLPAETYVKGFLRTYAEYLGLDGQLYVDEFNSRFVSGEEHEPRVRRSAARAPQ